MSPLWRDRLHIVLSPRRVIMVRLGKGLSPKVAAKAVIPCPEPAGAAPGAAWQGALATLLQALSERQWKNAEARVILSNHLVHYLLVPWQETLSSEEEQLALVRYSFTQVYGESVDDWYFLWNEGRPPASSLACGVDRPLLAGLREGIKAAGLRLTSIQPYLMAAFNRWRRQLDGRRDWFLLAEPGRLCLAWFEDDEWAGLNCQQVGEAWGAQLPEILERNFLLSGQTRIPERLCIYAPEMPAGELALAEGWSGSLLQLPAVPGFVPANDAGYAMAMSI